MMSWLYVLIASLCEICWMYCLKYFKWRDLYSFRFNHLLLSKANLLLLVPGFGYVLFGVGNIVFFSKAMHGISASKAFAIWMGVALIGSKLVDSFLLKEAVTPMQLVFLGLILIGVVGLKMVN